MVTWVSIHAPARGATPDDDDGMPFDGVSIHAPALGATARACVASRAVLCFNPRARAGRDLGPAQGAGRVVGVSIHAPARGATSGCCDAQRSILVSIHAPARGATLTAQADGKRYIVSIHAPARGATFTFIFKRLILLVSIHAPARGATVCQESPLFSPRYNEHSDDLDSSAGKSCTSSGEGSIFCFITI